MEQPEADERKQSRNNYTEDSNYEKPACQEEFCPLDQLPLEVLEEIFSYLSFNDRKNVRLVCTSLYEACGRNEHVRIRNENQWEEFRSCGLNNMNLTIDFIEGEWNPVVWREVGGRIRSLHMNTVTPGHGSLTIEKIGLENVIMFCENLQTLRISLRNGNALRFCSPDVLQDMNIVRNKLETLIIQRKDSRGDSGCRPDKWMKSFTALLPIFPNVRHYTTGSLYDINYGGRYFSCSCSVKPEFTDQSELAAALAFMLSGSKAHWSRALGILSKLRFSVISFIGWGQEHATLRMALSEFFEKQKALVSGNVKQGNCMNFTASEERAFERSVIQRIAFHWASIRDLHLDRAGLLRNHTTCRSSIELSDLNSDEQPNLDVASLDFDSGLLDDTPLYLRWKHEPGATDIYPREILKRYKSISYLILTIDVSDKMLQTVFQYMTRLKRLKVRLGRHNTCFGLTGSLAERASDCSRATSYSIKCLQQLESLSITSDGFSFDDSIYDEFDFPKLYFLDALTPKELTTLRNLILKLPALEQITFHTQQVASFLDVICSVRKNPIFISFNDVRESFSTADRKNFFDSHSSLNCLCINNRNYLRWCLDG